MMTLFYSRFYYRGIKQVTREGLSPELGISIEAARVLHHDPYDLVNGFLSSSYGKEVMTRAGVPVPVVPDFLAGTRERIFMTALTLPSEGFLTLHDVGMFLYAQDEALRNFLFSHGVTEEDFLGASSWVSRVRLVHKYKKRWWSRDNLGKREGIGREFSFGVAYELSQYVRNLDQTSALKVDLKDVAYANEVIERLEVILTRNKSANALLVGEEGAGEMDMLILLGKRMREGTSLTSLSGKRLMVFDTSTFIATHTNKDTFEATFLTLMDQAERAGSIILVIENLPHFIRSVGELGSDAGQLLGRFLSSPYIQIVGTSDPGSYHAELEGRGDLIRNFEVVMVTVPDLTSTILVLEEAAWQYEARFGYFFTYPAIVRVATCADQYIVEGVMPDKALNLLSAIASDAAHEGLLVITDVFVDTRVSATLGIPVGPIRDGEREMLLHLEEELHKRVVGQEAALSAIAGAMRRARAGIGSTKRPIGSFLFLGSTGVGKTETAKALATLFFGGEEKMVRFDMSEFSGRDGLMRLIGDGVHAGALASALKEHPYCVLLLDELEKATTEVHDLFLQVLDEGIFTDGRGSRVNARNTIVVATSNAGSALIWELTQAGRRPQDEKDRIIDTVISERIFRPELINRFDATIIFASLEADEQRTIARFMLTDLEKRIRDRGYTLVVNDTLLDVLMKEGYNPEFGARPMRRAIQDVIEERVARKIIEGRLRPGTSIEFTSADFV
jgi:ATP-dependent Clp protease ATP-binding subunit ClpC